MAEEKKDSIFFNPFEDLDASDTVQKITTLVRPLQNNFDFSKIGNFKDILGTVFETGQTFRNVFNTSVSPMSIADLASAGLQTQLSELLGKTGISKFLDGRNVTFNKTKYGYVESERKLNKSPNINLDFNPIGIFSSIIENLINSDDSGTDQDKINFYQVLNTVRRKIYNLNAQIYMNIEKIRVLHSEVNLKETVLTTIFHSEDVFSERFNIREQIKNFVFRVEDYLIQIPEMSSKVSNRLDYIACVTILKSQSIEMSNLLKHRETAYIHEDLKLLRKTPDNELKLLP